MSKAPKTPQHLTLDLSGPRITADHFASAVNAFLDLIEQVSKDMAGASNAVVWIISVSEGSALVNAVPEVVQGRTSVRPPHLVEAISRGMKLVELRAQRPRYFSDSALRIVRDLGKVPDGQNVEHARIRAATSATEVSERTVGHVDRLLGADVTAYGTIEGQLQTLSERRGAHFAVYDALTDQAIRCSIHRDRLPEAWHAFGRRVAVSGTIKYRKNGTPVSIEVEESIFVFPDEDGLPTADDVYGILTAAQ